MRRCAWLLSLLVLLGCFAACAEDGRTVFVNPASGKKYHAVQHCISLLPALWDGMQEMSVYDFASSDYSGYRRCEYCFRELEDLNSPLDVGQLGADGIYYPLWQPDDGTVWEERALTQLTADLNGDGLNDKIGLYLFPDGQGTVGERLASGAMVFLKIWIGLGENRYYPDVSFVSRGLTQARAGNGTLLLVRKNGENYIVDCNFLIRRGQASFDYTVYQLKNKLGISMTERRSVSFDAGTQESVLPDYLSALKRWTDGAGILMSVEAGLEPVLAGDKPQPLGAHLEDILNRSL